MAMAAPARASRPAAGEMSGVPPIMKPVESKDSKEVRVWRGGGSVS